jgi:hypothetical protein
MVSHIADVQPFAATEARIDEVLEVLDNLDDDLILGQWAMTEVMRSRFVGIGTDNPLRQPWERFLESKIGSHR